MSGVQEPSDEQRGRRSAPYHKQYEHDPSWTPNIPELPWPIDSLQYLWATRGTFYAADEKAEAWTKTADMVKTYSDEMVARWEKEIDTLLVFAGLFSAILTACNVESYSLLQPAPPDQTLAVLYRISAQLSNTPAPNDPIPPFPSLQAQDSAPPLWIVWLNVLWFSGLVCSLAAASIGLTVKQWLNQFKLGLSGTSRDVARLRQYRLNGLNKWRVGSIVAVLPVLLQIALGLFLAGMLLLLWNLHHTVAVAVASLVAVLVLFFLVTSVLPTILPDCSYVSPQALAVYSVWSRITASVRWSYGHIVLGLTFSRWWYHAKLLPCIRRAKELVASAGSQIRSRGAVAASPAPPTLQNTATVSEQLLLYYLHSDREEMKKPFRTTWRRRERDEVMGSSGFLDADTLALAYRKTLDPIYLDYAGVCILDLEVGELAQYCRSIRECIMRHISYASFSGYGWLGVVRGRPQFWASFLLPLLWTWGTEEQRELAGDMLTPEDLSFQRSYPQRFPECSLDKSAWTRVLGQVSRILAASFEALPNKKLAFSILSMKEDVLHYPWNNFPQGLSAPTDLDTSTIKRATSIFVLRLRACDLSLAYSEQLSEYLFVLGDLLLWTDMCYKAGVDEEVLQVERGCLVGGLSNLLHILRDPAWLWHLSPRNLDGSYNLSHHLVDVVKYMVKHRDLSVIPPELPDVLDQNVLQPCLMVDPADWVWGDWGGYPTRNRTIEILRSCIESLRRSLDPSPSAW